MRAAHFSGWVPDKELADRLGLAVEGEQTGVDLDGDAKPRSGRDAAFLSSCVEVEGGEE